MNLLDITILALATWRIGSLLAEEDGPYSIFANLRYRMGERYDSYSNQYIEPKGTRWYHTLLTQVVDQMTCLWCVTIWIGILLTLLYIMMPVVTVHLSLPFALSTAAVYINGRGIRARKRFS